MARRREREAAERERAASLAATTKARALALVNELRMTLDRFECELHHNEESRA